MHFHLPKPMHGWREFAGEVGIIVIGVLIALAAEQLVENIHARDQLSQYQGATNKELAFDLAAFDFRVAQSGCVRRRIAELGRWRSQWQSGSGKPLAKEIGRPSIIIMRVSVRNSAPANALTRLPIDERAAIAALYDSLDNNEQQIRDERDSWRSLAAFNHATDLTHEDLMRLDELIYRVASIQRVLETNDRQVQGMAKRLGVRPDLGSDRPHPTAGVCEAVLEP